MGTTSDKLTYLNDTKNLLRQGINAIGGEIETTDTFRSYVDELENIYEELPKVTGSGTSVTLDNTRKGGLRVVLNPSELEQETTTGKNLFDGYFYNGPVAYDTDYTNIDIGRVLQYSNLTSKYYTFGGYFKAGTYTFSVQKNDYYVTINRIAIAGTNSIQSGYHVRNSYTWTQTVDGYTYFSLERDDGETSYTDINFDGTDFMLQIESGSTETSYEPYTGGIASPNPSYPQQIHTISGDNEIKVENKNLFNKIDVINGYYLKAGGGLVTNENSFYTDYYDVHSYTNITFSGLDNSEVDRRIVFYDINKTVIDYFATRNRTINVPTANALDTSKTPYYIRISASKDYLNTLQLELGSTATTYIEHKEQVKEINLGSLEYCEIGNYKDKIDKSTGKNLLNIENSESGGIDSSGNEASGTTLWRGNEYILVKPNTQYVLSSTKSMTLRLYEYSESKTFISPRTEGIGTSLTITTGNNTKYLRWSIYNEGNTITLDNAKSFNLMLNEGSTPLPYEPYGTKWYIKKNIGKVVLDGTETGWGQYQSNVYITSLFSPGVSSNLIINGYCNYSNTSTKINICYNSNANTGLEIKNLISYWGLNDTLPATWKSYLQTLYNNGNPFTLYYPLATSTYTILNNTLQTQLEDIYNTMKSYNGQTLISQVNDDLAFNMLASALESFEE